MNRIILSGLACMLLMSCISKKEFAALEEENARLKEMLENERKAKKVLKKKGVKLATQNDQLMSSLVDLSVLTKKDSESLSNSLKILEKERKLVRSLQSNVSKRNALNLNLVQKLKSALDDPNDSDVNIQVEKGAVYISISGDMLFPSGNYNLNGGGKNVLAKIAKIVKQYPEIDVMVEGHTDNRPIKTTMMKDNWDLSVKRAASVVRLLQDKYGIDPSKLIASGRSEYAPIASNKTSSGKAMNRRTTIILLPDLSQVFDILLDKK